MCLGQMNYDEEELKRTQKQERTEAEPQEVPKPEAEPKLALTNEQPVP